MLYEIHEATIVATNLERKGNEFATLYVRFLVSTSQGDQSIVGEYELINPSAQAEEDGRAALAELHRAAGVSKPGDADSLIGKRVDLGVKLSGGVRFRAFSSPEKAAHYMRPTAFSAKRSK